MNTVKTDLKTSLNEYFGFDSFKGEQEKVISNLLAIKIHLLLCLQVVVSLFAINFLH